MKNFKKVLALVLVVAMVMAFATVSSAAFTDAASIAKTEAVDVLSTLGVINGYEDGSFKPEGTVTRAEMAKMIATILNKGEDVGAMYAGACTFADTASHWAAGYVAFCAQEQIINGKNATTFAPDATVTGTEAAKMVLGALGHAADKAGLIGSAWASTTLSLAKKNNLIGELNNLSVNMGEAMTRENAAQLLLNGLKATMVEYAGGTNITIGNVVLNQGATATPVAQTGTDYANRVGNTTQELAEECFPNKLKVAANGTDAYGRTCNVWSYENVVIGSYNVAPYKTYTTQVTLGQLYTDLGKVDSTKLTGGITAFTNGSANATTQANLASSLKSGEITKTIGAQGTHTEVYFDPITMTLNVAEIEVYAGEILQVVPAVKDANGDIAAEAYVVVKPLYSAPNAPAGWQLTNGTITGANTVVTDAFTLADKGAIVTYSVGQNVTGVGPAGLQIQEVAKATAITGTNAGFSALAGAYVTTTIDTTTYNINKTAGTGYGSTFGTAETIYVDANNNVVYTTAVASSDYLYVLGFAAATSFTQEQQAQVVLMDGSVKIVDLAAVHNNGAGVIAKTVYNYVVDAAGKYTLAPVTNNTVAVAGKVTNKVPAVGAHAADVNTIFVLGTKDPTTMVTTYTAYTGIAAVPSFDVATTAAKYAVNPLTNNVAVLFAEETVATGTSTTSVMALYKTGLESTVTAGVGNQYISVAAVIDGKVTTVKVTPALYATMTANQFALVSGGMTDTFGNYTALTKVADSGSYQQAWNFTTFVAYQNGNVTLDTAKYVEATTPVVAWNLTTGKLQTMTIDALYEMAAATTGTYTTELSTVPGVQGAITGIYVTVQY